MPNAVIQIAEDLRRGDVVREALKNEGLLGGKPILRREVAIDLAAKASGISPSVLAKALDDQKTNATIRASTDEFNLLPVNQRPTFLLRSTIEDTVILSGIYRPEPVLAAIDAMISDEDAYDRFRESHPPMPVVVSG